MLHGWWAKATESFLWLICGAGAYGFLKRKGWMFPWAALYTFQVAIAMLVWSFLYGGGNLVFGVVAAMPFVILGAMLLKAKSQFNGMVDEPLSDLRMTDG